MQSWLAAVDEHAFRLVALSAAGLIVAYVVAEAAARAVRAVLGAMGGGGPWSFSGPIVRTPIRVTRAVVFVASCLVFVVPVLTAAGVPAPARLDLAALSAWLLTGGLRILLIALLTYLLVRAIAVSAEGLEVRIGSGGDAGAAERGKRARTLSRLVRNVLTVVVLSMAGLMILRAVGVDILPVLTGAGILGLAVGFGAQALVRDVISGFFLILENHLRVGDVVTIDGTGGIVEHINLRTTAIRDLEGTVHVFPNGSFERFSNRTKDFSFYVIDVGVAYKEDTDRVCASLEAVGEELCRDATLAAAILSPLEILGVDAFEDSQVTIKVRIKTLPLKQWDVGRELRRRIKKAFDRDGIEIPFPHLSVYVGEASRPWVVESRGGSQPNP